MADNWKEILVRQVPNLVVFLLLVYIFGNYVEKRDVMLEAVMNKTVKALEENTKMLGRVEHAIETK